MLPWEALPSPETPLSRSTQRSPARSKSQFLPDLLLTSDFPTQAMEASK